MSVSVTSARTLASGTSADRDGGSLCEEAAPARAHSVTVRRRGREGLALPARAGSRLGKYVSGHRFLERGFIARGGMSIVVRALDRRIQREVALKLLLPELEDEETAVGRVKMEARVMARLEHPNIPALYELHTDNRGLPFLSMKLLEGETLEDAIGRAGGERLAPRSLTGFIDAFVDVCHAVAFAHAHGFIHRDLKPANVMMTSSGKAYVIDWGVAQRLTPRTAAPHGGDRGRASTPTGTPCYMAPEQRMPAGVALDERVDVFGLGAVLYQILTGEPPRSVAMMRRDAPGGPESIRPPQDVVQSAHVSRGLCRVVMRALAHGPGDRYPSVLDLLADLRRVDR